MRRLALAMLAAVLLACGPMKADDTAAKIHGVWKLTSYKVRIVGESGPPRNMFGADPKGYVVFTPEARMMLLITAANRKPPTNDGETAALFKTMAAFSGRYAVDAEKIVIMPDVSWNEIYAADEQIHYYKIDGDNLSLRSTELKSADMPGKRIVASMELVRERRAPVAAVIVRADAQAIDLAVSVDRPKSEGDRVTAWTVPGADGKTRRLEVRAREANASWMAFALANNGDEQIDRLLVAPHYRLVGSGLLWPDLGRSRIVDITPSGGERPEREDSRSADIFRIAIDPGTVTTFIAELRTDRLPQIFLWEPDAYRDKIDGFTLYYGILIGIVGLLALCLTILWVVKGGGRLAAGAAVGWAVLANVGIDIGFWGSVIDLSAHAQRVWRAASEAMLAAMLLVFLFAYLGRGRRRVRSAQIVAGSLILLAALAIYAFYDPTVASGIARLSLGLVAAAGFAVVAILAARGSGRAMRLIPTWLAVVAWVIAAGLAVTGIATNDRVEPALLGGMVLILVLVGLTVLIEDGSAEAKAKVETAPAGTPPEGVLQTSQRNAPPGAGERATAVVTDTPGSSSHSAPRLE